MKQLFAAVMAGTFALVAAAPVVAAEKADPAVTKACKGKKAGDDSDHILYDDNTGICRYDRDGKGGDKAKAFALLAGAPDVDAGDFTVVA